jgi:hypothetical protein
MASGKPFYGDRIGPARGPGEKVPNPSIKDMAPFDEYSLHPVPILDPMEMLLLPTPSKSTHYRDEPDNTDKYASGGRVRKFGSSTHVTCKSKG